MLYRFSVNYFSIEINKKGWITGMQNTEGKTIREYARKGKPSPLLSLYNNILKTYYTPTQGSYDAKKKQCTLRYSNGAVAVVRIEPLAKYVRTTLASVSTRKGVDEVKWEPYYTTISNLFGEVIGVARDTSDAAPFQYSIHSPDKKLFSLPANRHLFLGECPCSQCLPRNIKKELANTELQFHLEEVDADT